MLDTPAGWCYPYGMNTTNIVEVAKVSVDLNNIPYRRIYARIDDLRALMLKRGYKVPVTIDGFLLLVSKKDRNWYVGEIA